MSSKPSDPIDLSRTMPWLAHTPQPDDPPPGEPDAPDEPPVGDPPPEPDEVPHFRGPSRPLR
jgi:hypothetical protein